MAFGLDDLRRLMGEDKAGGAKTVAAILNTMNRQAREEVLAAIEEESPQLAEDIRSFMFVFEDLAGLDQRSLREVVREADQSRLALALRGVAAPVVDAFCSAMSERQAAMVRDDVEAMGPQRAADVEAARRDVTAAAKRLEAQGRIVLRPG
ncbi:MAG: FliG C-terminal domain-containing protein, partial [Desulfovibrionaceae bacterium]